MIKSLLILIIIGGASSCSVYVVQNSEHILLNQETRDGILVERAKEEAK